MQVKLYVRGPLIERKERKRCSVHLRNPRNETNKKYYIYLHSTRFVCEEKLLFDRNANASISMESVAFIHVSFVFPPARNVIRGNDVLNRPYGRHSVAVRSGLDAELDVNRATRAAKN